MFRSLFADLSWLPGEDFYWIVGAGVTATALAFLFATQLFARQGPTENTAAAATPGSVKSNKDPFDSGAPSERRQAFRRKGSSITVLITDVAQTIQGWEGWVVDRSTSGIGLWSERQASPGLTVRIRPENAPPMTPWIDVEVRSCKPSEGGWQLGCAFLQTPSYSVLLLFG
jgi:hypothetical protein